MRWTRRRFLGGSVAAACVGCSAESASPPGPTNPARPPSSTPPTHPPVGDIVVAPTIGGIEVGPLADLRDGTEPTYVPAARAYLVALTDEEAELLAATADESLLPGLEHGVLALAQKCPHLGCRVLFCDSSGWFECACHGAMFNRVGEHQAGPGPRGLDASPVVVNDGVVSIGGGDLVQGAPVGTVGLDLPPSGPHCVGDTSH